MGMPNHPNQMMRCHDLHDRNGLTVGPCAFRGRELHEPLHQKLLPQSLHFPSDNREVWSFVKLNFLLVFHQKTNSAGSPNFPMIYVGRHIDCPQALPLACL
jgi:hypothetical protein